VTVLVPGGDNLWGHVRHIVVASQRVRPEVAGPMTGSAKQSMFWRAARIASSLALLAKASLQ